MDRCTQSIGDEGLGEDAEMDEEDDEEVQDYHIEGEPLQRDDFHDTFGGFSYRFTKTTHKLSQDIARLETKIDSFQTHNDERFDRLEGRFDSLKALIRGLGIGSSSQPPPKA